VRLFPYAVFIAAYYLVRALFCLSQGNDFYVSILNVGQGDSIVVNIPNYGLVLVDAGIDYQSNYLSARALTLPLCGIKSVFITHYDRDHAGGLERLRKFCPELAVYDNLSYGDVVTFGAVRLYILSPAKKDSTHQENDDSLVMLLKYRDFEGLFTGDAGLSVLEPLVTVVDSYKRRGIVSGDLDVYKVSHHGSPNNNSKRLLDGLKPTYCVISVGKNNYGHPGKAVLKDIADAECLIQRTDEDGTISYTSR
jgi:competence protein ComEC